MAPREESNTLLLFSGYTRAKETHQVDVAVLLEDLCEGGGGAGEALVVVGGAGQGREGAAPTSSSHLLGLLHLGLL